MADTSNKVGDLNGKWSLLFKLALATYPMVLGWSGWVTVEMITMKANRFTIQDGIAQHEQYRTELSAHADHGHPPKWVEASVQDLKVRMDTLDSRNLVDQLSLERLEDRIAKEHKH